jgi:hypothetical protein
MNRVTTGDAQYIGNEYGLQMGVSGTGNSSIQTIGYINSTDTVEAQYNLQLQPNGGYVGIGTTNPQSLLHISSGTSGDAHLILEADTDNDNENDNPKLVFRQDGGYYTGEIGLDSNRMVFRNKSTTVENTGFAFYANVIQGGSSTTDINDVETTQVRVMSINGIGDVELTGNLEVSSSNLFVDTTTSRVGVGTASPGAKLHVVVPDIGNTTEVLRLQNGNGTGDILTTSGGFIGMHLRDNNVGGGEVARISWKHDGTDSSAEGLGQLGFWTSNTGGAEGVPEERMTIRADGNVGIGTNTPQAKLDTRGDAIFDTGKDDTTLTGLLNYSSTQSAIDAGINTVNGSLTASTDIAPPPGVAGDVIAKFVNSHTTEVITNQFTASPLSITTGDVIYFGIWVYATLSVSVEYFFFGPSGQYVAFTATGNSTWTWYEKTITSTSTTSTPTFRIDNNSAGKTYYFTGFTIRKNPSQTTGLPFTPRYSPMLGRGSVLNTTTLVAREAAIKTLTGNVGIGTTNPLSTVDISGTTGLILRNTADKTAVDDRVGYIEFYNGSTVNGNMSSAIEACVNVGGANNNTDLRFKTSLDYNNSLVERMRIDRAGNVGIGTTNPGYTLDVAGSINLTSNIVMSGEVFVKAHDATKNYVAVGRGAGQSNQGTNAVAVGYLAGQTSQHDNTVVLNASGSALNTEGTGRTYIKPLRVATVASNVMTYDQTTGEVMDSGGLFTNRLAVVSEQPPSALTGATTTIQGHGKYVVTSSKTSSGDLADWNIFNKVAGNGIGDAWSTGTGYYDSNGTHIGDGTLGGVGGEWLKLEIPYKTKLRHISLTPRSTSHYANMPEVFTILGSNDDSSWTTLKALTGQTWTSPNDVKYVIDASVSYKYYAIVVEEINENFATIGEWRLFTESFSVDGGIMTTTAASGLETGFTEHPVAPMTDYKTYVEGHGTYEASASSISGILYPWQAFDRNTGTRFSILATDGQYDETTGIFTTTVTTPKTIDVGGTRYNGHWLQLKTPYPIVLSHSDIFPTGNLLYRAPVDGVILGSNDGEAWYKLTEFSGKTYSSGVWTNIDVNATTPYQYFRMCITKIGTGELQYGITELEEWRLFSATGVTKMDNVLISGELAVDGGALQTSHIKWPKVPLKANESEGYVASASSIYSGIYWAFSAFEDKGEYTNGNAPAWASGNGSFSSGSAGTSRTTGSDTFNHEWLQIQLPQAIQLSYFNISKRIGSNRFDEVPKSGYMYGSNDGVTWTKLVAYSDLTYVDYQPTRVNVQCTTPYTYYRLAVTVISGSQAFAAINELQLFESTLGVGTSATTAKLTVDGGLGLAKGSQVFAGSDVVMELPKHDRPLVKYPEVAMTVAIVRVGTWRVRVPHIAIMTLTKHLTVSRTIFFTGKVEVSQIPMVRTALEHNHLKVRLVNG